ncbi:hypothetical protein C6V07_06055 [Burkholderia gladioli]|nr:hypothetical protein C6V07_06055 [Burkholderia gladioli]
MTADTTPMLDDTLWSMIQPLLPPAKPRRTRYPGRKPLDDRSVMAGILFVLESGIPWGQLPQELGYGSGMSCWRRLRDWQQAGAWGQIHAVLMKQLHMAERIDWSRVFIESPSSRSNRAETPAAQIMLDAPAPRAPQALGPLPSPLPSSLSLVQPVQHLAHVTHAQQASQPAQALALSLSRHDVSEVS